MSKIFQERLWNIKILHKVIDGAIFTKFILNNPNLSEPDNKIETKYLRMEKYLGNFYYYRDCINNNRYCGYYRFSCLDKYNNDYRVYIDSNDYRVYTDSNDYNKSIYFKYSSYHVPKNAPSPNPVETIIKKIEINKEDTLDLFDQFKEIHDKQDIILNN